MAKQKRAKRPLTQVRQLQARLRYIHRVANGEIHYASDFGRVCTIERIAKSSRLPADLREVVYGR